MYNIRLVFFITLGIALIIGLAILHVKVVSEGNLIAIIIAIILGIFFYFYEKQKGSNNKKRKN